MKTYQLFLVLISNAKTTEEIEFNPITSLIKYHQELSNIFCLSSLAASIHSIGEMKAATSLANYIEESSTLQSNKFRNRIKLANAIIKDKLRHNSQHHLRYNLKKWVNNSNFYILNFTFVQLLDTLGNENYGVSS